MIVTMEIKTLAELTRPDQRTLAFTPLGLSTMGLLRGEDAAEFQQQVIAHCDLSENVAEGTRNSFERLRTLHSYGVLCYEAYTVLRIWPGCSLSKRYASGSWSSTITSSRWSRPVPGTRSLSRPTISPSSTMPFVGAGRTQKASGTWR